VRKLKLMRLSRGVVMKVEASVMSTSMTNTGGGRMCIS